MVGLTEVPETKAEGNRGLGRRASLDQPAPKICDHNTRAYCDTAVHVPMRNSVMHMTHVRCAYVLDPVTEPAARGSMPVARASSLNFLGWDDGSTDLGRWEGGWISRDLRPTDYSDSIDL